MKKIIYVIIGLAVIYLVLCICGPARTRVERSIEINAQADALKSKITDLKFFQESWSPWTEKDPQMKVIFTGNNGEEGSSMAWVSNNEDVGKGSMTYNYTHGDTVMQTLHFDSHGDSKVYHIVTPKGGGSKVRWVMESETPFLERAIMLFMNMDKMLGPDFEKGLKKLKKSVEEMDNSVTAGDYQIMEMEWDAKTFYGKRTKAAVDKLAAFFGESYGKIGGIAVAAKVSAMGAPKAIYFSFDESTMVADVAAVEEFAKDAKLTGLEKFETPAGRVLHIAYYGPYEKSGEAHYAMDAYMKTNNLTQVSVIEEYVTDPMTEKDPAKWLTNIYYIVK